MINKEELKRRARENDTLHNESDKFIWQVPVCCREGWESCPHAVKRPKPTKKNIGL